MYNRALSVRRALSVHVYNVVRVHTTVRVQYNVVALPIFFMNNNYLRTTYVYVYSCTRSCTFVHVYSTTYPIGIDLFILFYVQYVCVFRVAVAAARRRRRARSRIALFIAHV